MARLIDADETIKWQQYGNTNSILYRQYTVEVLENAPTVDAAPVVHGRWIDMGDFESCSVCKSTQLKKFESMYGTAERVWTKTNYCPDCGAKMDLKSLEMNEFTEMDSGN